MFNVWQLAVAINMIEKLMLTQWKELTRLPSVILTDEMDIYHTQCHSYVVAIVSRQKPNKVHARVTVVSFFSSFFRQRSIKSEHLALFFFREKKKLCVFNNKLSLISYVKAFHGHASSKLNIRLCKLLCRFFIFSTNKRHLFSPFFLYFHRFV